MLYSLTNSSKKYTCEACADTPKTFLTSIVTNICSPSTSSIFKRTDDENRMDTLEHQVNSIVVALEKFELQTISENLNTLGSKLEQMNNNLTGNVKAVQKIQREQEVANVVEQPTIDGKAAAEIERLTKDLDFAKKEIAALQSSNELLMGTVTERDTALAKLSGKFEKNLLALNERDKWLNALEYEKKRLLETNTIASNNIAALSQECSSKVEALNIENNQYVKKLEETQEKLLEVSRKLDSELEVNKTLREQVKELVTLNKAIHNSASNHPARRSRNDNP